MTMEQAERINRLLTQAPLLLVSDPERYVFSEADMRIIEKHITAMSKELHMEVRALNLEFRFNKTKK